MIQVTIPGREPMQIEHLILDVDGTIALDGVPLPGVQERLVALQEYVEIHLLTEDNYGTQAAVERVLGLSAKIVQHGGTEKGGYALQLGAEQVAAIGNGMSDLPLFNTVALRIAVLGPEGLAAALLPAADLLVRDVIEGLDLLLAPDRIVATLRR